MKGITASEFKEFKERFNKSLDAFAITNGDKKDVGYTQGLDEAKRVFTTLVERFEEQKYYVMDGNGAMILARSGNMDDERLVYPVSGRKIENVKLYKDEHSYQFTEQEIKDYDPRYLPFKRKVEEFD